MYPSSKLKPAIGLLAFMLAGAACALAQAEINPDHFPDPAQPTLTVKKTAVSPASTKIAAVKRSSVVTTQPSASHRESAVHGSARPAVQAPAASHTRHTTSNAADVAQHDSDNKKKLVSEARRHATP